MQQPWWIPDNRVPVIQVGNFAMPYASICEKFPAMAMPIYILKGAGSGSYAPGSVVNITADAPPSCYIFYSWIGDTASIDDITDPTTFITVPSSPVAIAASYLPVASCFCPINNYIWNPAVFTNDQGWYDIGTAPTEEIRLICSDNGDRRLAFNVTCIGGYTVEVYGAGGALLFTQNKASANAFNYQFTLGAGVPNVTYSTFLVRIFPTTASHLTTFQVTTITGNGVTNWQILQAQFNTPEMATLSNAFVGIDSLQYCQFLTSLNFLTTLALAFQGCSVLRILEFPSMSILNTMASMCNGCSILLSCTLPSTLPALTTLNATFQNCYNLPSQVYPSNLPELTTMANCHYNNYAFKSVTLPLTAAKLNSMASCFYYCTSLPLIVMPASLPLLNNLSYCWYNNISLLSITFCTSIPVLANCLNMCTFCKVLKTFVFPATQNSLTSLSNSFSSCYGLVSITLPVNAPGLLSLYQTFWECFTIQSITFPVALTNVTTMYQVCQNCYALTTVVYPASMNSVLTWYAGHFTNKLLTSFTGPTSMNVCTTIGQLFYNCYVLSSCVLPASMNLLQDCSSVFFGANSMTSITPPPNLPVCSNISSFSSSSLLAYLGPITFGTIQVNASSITSTRVMATFSLLTLRVTVFSISSSPLAGNQVTSVDIAWNLSSWSNAVVVLILNYLNISATEINRIFTALPVVVGKTVNVANCTGSAGCTPAIAQAKGWTVVR